MGTLGVATLTTEVDLSGLQRGLAKGQQQTQGMADKIGRAANVAFAAAIAAVAAFVVDSIAEFQNFERGMAEVFSIMPGTTEEAMSQMTDDVLSFTQEVGRTSDEVVPALYQALSSGVPASNVFDFMKIASDAALGGVTTLETAVNGITSAVNAYGAETLSAQEASDLMFTATVGGKTTFEELSQSLYNVIPTAASLNLEFGNVTAALAAMTAQGTPTSVATTQLRQLLVELSKDGGEAAAMFERMAGQSFVDFIASGGNLQDALMLMEQAAADSNVRLSDLFGSVEAGNAALSLTGSGAAKFSAELEAAANSAGATSDAAAVMADTMQHTEDIVAAQTSELKILIAEGLAPTKRAWLDLKQVLLEAAIESAKASRARRENFSTWEEERDIQGDVIDQLNEYIKVNEVAISTSDGYADAQEGIWEALDQINARFDPYNGSLADSENNTRAVAAALELLQEGFAGTGAELGAAAVAMTEQDALLAQLQSQTSTASLALTDFGRAQAYMAENAAASNTVIGEQTEAMSLQEQQLALVASGEREMTFTTQAAVTAGQIASETHREQAEALAETTAAFASYFVAATQATDAVGFFSTTTTEAGAVLVDATINQSSLNQAMYDAAVQGGATAEQLAILGLATGVLSEEQAEAALKSAILQAEVTALAAAYVAGDLSISELRTEMANLVADVNAMDVEIGASTGTVEIFEGAVAGAGEELVTAADRARGFRDAAEDAAGDYSIHFNITTTGSIPDPTGDGGAAHGGYQPGFLLGGYTGSGRADEIAGFVHANEYVLPADAVEDLGLPFLESLRRGDMRPRDSFDYGAVDPVIRPQTQNAAANGAKGDTFVFDLRGAVISSQAEMEKWVDAALLKKGVRADTIIRTR